MLEVAHFKNEVLNPILKKFSDDQSLANAYCVIWAIDSYATHMALDPDGSPQNAYRLEKEFKERLAASYWQFRLVQEASNATKHAIRKQDSKDVLSSSDLKSDKGVSWYAYYNNVDGGVTIDTDWEYRQSENAFFDSRENLVDGFSGVGRTIYLSSIISCAIEAIEVMGGAPQNLT